MCRVQSRFTLPEAVGTVQPGPHGADARGAASGATGAAGGASLARCGRRRNSLCPFLAAAATRCSLHVDEAARGALSLPPTLPPPPPDSGLAGGGGASRGPTAVGGPGVGRGLGSGFWSPAARGASCESWGAGRLLDQEGSSNLGRGPRGTEPNGPGWTYWGDKEGEATRLKLRPLRCCGWSRHSWRPPPPTPETSLVAGSLKGASRRMGQREAAER